VAGSGSDRRHASARRVSSAASTNLLLLAPAPARWLSRTPGGQ